MIRVKFKEKNGSYIFNLLGNEFYVSKPTIKEVIQKKNDYLSSNNIVPSSVVRNYYVVEINNKYIDDKYSSYHSSITRGITYSKDRKSKESSSFEDSKNKDEIIELMELKKESRDRLKNKNARIFQKEEHIYRSNLEPHLIALNIVMYYIEMHLYAKEYNLFSSPEDYDELRSNFGYKLYSETMEVAKQMIAVSNAMNDSSDEFNEYLHEIFESESTANIDMEEEKWN